MSKTYIYVIDNQINDKLYVGMTSNPAARWLVHLRSAKKGAPYLIYNAMKKHGVEHFEMVILECVSSRDCAKEREKYWINILDTMRSGYNMTTGGDGLLPGSENVMAKLSKDEALRIYRSTKTEETYVCIGELFGVSDTAVSQIARGITWSSVTNHDISKTSIKRKCGARGMRQAQSKLSDNEVREIYSAAKNESETFKVIGTRYGISSTAVRQIANGYTWTHITGHCKDQNHKTRRKAPPNNAKLTTEKVLAIYRAVTTDNESLTSVSKRLGVPVSTVNHISKGRTWSDVTGHRRI